MEVKLRVDTAAKKVYIVVEKGQDAMKLQRQLVEVCDPDISEGQFIQLAIIDVIIEQRIKSRKTMPKQDVGVVTCKGSLSLGTACGKCARCQQEQRDSGRQK